MEALPSTQEEAFARLQDWEPLGECLRLLQFYRTKILEDCPRALLESWIQDWNAVEHEPLQRLLNMAIFHDRMAPFLQTLLLGQESDLLRSGGVATFDQLNHYLLISEMIVAPSFYWNVAHGRQPGEVQEDLEALSVLQNLGQNMAYLLEMQNRTRAELPPPAPVARAWTNFIR